VTVTVGATSRCTFTSQPSASWVRTVSGASGSGVSNVLLRVAANPSAAPRTASVTIAGQTVTIVQDAGPAAVGDPQMSLEQPLDGARVGSVFRVTGWAVDLAALDGTSGVSTVHVWAYPSSAQDAPIFLGAAEYGAARPDVEALLGDGTRQSGFSLVARGLTPGVYRLVAFARSIATGSFNQVRTATVTVQPDPRVVIDLPASAKMLLPTVVSGWAVDALAEGTPAIEAVQAWAVPAGGGSAIFVGAATYGIDRPDVAAAFSKPEFARSGFTLSVAGLEPGQYKLVISAKRTGASTFDCAGSVEVEVQSPLAHDIALIPRIGVVKQASRAAGGPADSQSVAADAIDLVHVWAYPVSGRPVFLGAVPARSGNGPAHGADADLDLSRLPAGTYRLVEYAHSLVSGVFVETSSRTVVVAPPPGQ
jgi:hypothetical protein